MTLNLTKLGLKQVINASGKMTILSVSKVSEGVLTAQRFGGEHFFEMSELAVKTGAYLAKLLQVEDAQIVSSSFCWNCSICGSSHWTRLIIPSLPSLFRKDSASRDHLAEGTQCGLWHTC